jgi:hypothetical protein
MMADKGSDGFVESIKGVWDYESPEKGDYVHVRGAYWPERMERGGWIFDSDLGNGWVQMRYEGIKGEVE